MSFVSSVFDMEWLSSDIVIYGCYFSVEEYEDELFDRFGVDFIPKLERAVSKRKAEYLAGRYAAQLALKPKCVGSAQVTTGASREPIWPKGIVGTISHSRDLAVSAVALENAYVGLGIDVEDIVTQKTQSTIASQVLSATERNIVEAWPLDACLAFTLVFSLKESFFKASFPLVKRYFDFDAISIVDLNLGEKPSIDFRICADLHPQFKIGEVMRGYFKVIESRVMTFVAISK
ncbi:4'-phosphopantetheinyl transferase family protein [Teredinibacter haidensis]|uniref:4'-phosphopantetheinyl transferase family protein n=1 Tax=Teredinibacter haidensis TaxID=2731755 RepID=UPI000948F99C|nr:4'-phosphopantetheinyl transferase superfamily protein [Teredinibacter haidensis]